MLWDDLALEVRWAVAGETIVLQLVGKIGTPLSLALYLSLFFGGAFHENNFILNISK